MPIPQNLIRKASSWSDSDEKSNSKNDEMFPKSKAVRGKFVFDPEHGGGRRRRDKHLPKQKQYTCDSPDKLEYQGKDSIMNFN